MIKKLSPSISNYLILASILVTLALYFNPYIVEFGMNTYHLSVTKNYYLFLMQLTLYQFLHSGILHILSNSLFILIFGNSLETYMNKTKYLYFFLLNTIFVAICLLIFSNGNTIGISGFAMAILSYTFLHLSKNIHPEYKSVGIFLIINILSGIGTNISFVGHFAGAVFGAIFFFVEHMVSRKK